MFRSSVFTFVDQSWPFILPQQTYNECITGLSFGIRDEGQKDLVYQGLLLNRQRKDLAETTQLRLRHWIYESLWRIDGIIPITSLRNSEKLDLSIGQMEILDAETPGEAAIALGLGEGGIDKTAPDADNNPVPSDLDTPDSALNDQIFQEDATLTPVEIDIPQNLA
ncbi:hypothetical protein MJO28_015538 [Puccinia striiformis f. sp. tritici]|uniref:Uncharacterized protein n=1 Tax=Puccinia striiformis f. sp. tritici TaxID=168172 RepID=A0ACC0DP14_9BASI|nr:hypothetical protein MJO28_015538 [Puccinia striiformis f. sp. tritici]